MIYNLHNRSTHTSKDEEGMPVEDTPQDEQPYSNMKARYVVLIIGLVMTLISFLCTFYATLALLVPAVNIPGVLPYTIICTFYIIALCLSFVGLVFAVAGANTNKPIARTSFFFAIISFIISAGFLLVLLLINFFPFAALGRLLS